jgi:hypothetical protein
LALLDQLLRHTFVPRIRYLGFTTRGKKGPLTTTGDLSACKSKRILIQLLTVNKHPFELLYMGLVGPARVRSVGGKWYVLVVVDDYSRYAWVFFLEEKVETFGFVRDLVLRLKNERHRDAIWAIHNDNDSEFRNSHFETFCHDLVLNISFRVRICLPRMAWWEGKTEPCVRWLGRCSMSIGLRDGSKLRRSIPRAMF